MKFVTHSLSFHSKKPINSLKIRKNSGKIEINYNQLYNKIGTDTEQSELTVLLQTVIRREHSDLIGVMRQFPEKKLFSVHFST